MLHQLTHLTVNIKRLLLVGVIVLLAFFLLGYAGRLLASSQLRQDVARWEAEVQLAQQQVDASRAQLAYTRSDRFVIDQAHSELGLVFPGEVLVRVTGGEPQAVLQSSPRNTQGAPTWRLWWQRLSGR
ncbi:MAG: septum formation initiator family protein [Caldilineales bacterium]